MSYLDPPRGSDPFISRCVADIHTDASAINTTVQTTLATFALPKTLVAGDAIRLVAAGDLLNNSGSAATYAWAATLGATTLHTLGSFSISAGASRRKWRVEQDILLAGTSDERSSATIFIGGAGSVSVSSSGMDRATATEDITAGKNLVLAITLGTAAATIDCYLHEAFLAVLKR